MLIDNQVIFVNTPEAAEVIDASLRQRGRSQAPRTEEDLEADALFSPRRTSRTGQEEKDSPEKDSPGGDVQEEDSKPADSKKDLYKIYEVYSPSSALPHRYLHLGSWRFEGGTVWSQFNDLENPLRRRDLTGLHLRCATINNFLPYVTIDRIGKEVRLRGWFADVYDSMREFFNFT
ncbi:uncharacterized protein LOC143026079 [Oratosquilla oratoria]|uniref:uncharacterized protein LOC143026079 n=1 Tax=Oratosquilla oratoria TaxID=337810 RepID=UPI003F76643D